MRLGVLVLILALSACNANSRASLYESDVFFKGFETALERKPVVTVADITNFPSDEVCLIKESDTKYFTAYNAYLTHRDFDKLQTDQQRFDLAYLIMSFKKDNQITRYFTKNGTYLIVNNRPADFLDAYGGNSRYFERCVPSNDVTFSLNDEKTFVITSVSGQKH